jgi:type III secretion system YscQ/HrcQ family protein
VGTNPRHKSKSRNRPWSAGRRRLQREDAQILCGIAARAPFAVPSPSGEPLHLNLGPQRITPEHGLAHLDCSPLTGAGSRISATRNTFDSLQQHLFPNVSASIPESRRDILDLATGELLIRSLIADDIINAADRLAAHAPADCSQISLAAGPQLAPSARIDVHLPKRALEFDHSRQENAEPASAELERLASVRGRILSHRISVTLSELRKATVGAAIELGRGRTVPRNVTLQLSKRNEWSATLTNNKIAIGRYLKTHTKKHPDYWEDSTPTERTDMISDESDRSQETTPGDLSDIMVNVDIQIGQVELSVAELRSLRPGALLEISTPDPDRVVLLTNGRTVGYGRLIDLDGKLCCVIEAFKHV